MADTKYRSVEERVVDYVSNSGPVELAKGFLEFAIPTAYGTAVTPFRVTTFARKCVNKQIWANRNYPRQLTNGIGPTTSRELGHVLGSALGFVSVGAAEIYGVRKVFQEANQGNYTPALALVATLAVTNLASGLFELGKRSASLEERAKEPVKVVSA